MRKILSVLVVLLLAALPVYAADSAVTYNGEAREFIFAPGSELSPSDLFDNFKSVMPGDTLTQEITVKNDAARNVKVKIYMRALGAHEGSEAFLSQLGLRVHKSGDNDMAYMFDAAADERAQLDDWVCLGMLYSGGEVNLDVLLDVPAEMGNDFQDAIGYLDWQFKVEEFPVEEGDPEAPQTGDDSRIGMWLTALIGSLTLLIILVLWRRRERECEGETDSQS